MKTVFVTSGTPESGVSTVAAGLSCQLAKIEKRVLLLELQPVPSAQKEILKVSFQPTKGNFEGLLLGQCSYEDAALQIPSLGINFIPACERIDWTEMTDSFEQWCQSVAPFFDYLILDGSVGRGAPRSTIASSIDTLLFVTTLERESICNAADMGAWWDTMGVKYQQIVFNKVANEVPKCCGYENLDRVMDAIGAPLLGIVPKMDDPLNSPAFNNMANRLEGIEVPLLSQFFERLRM